MLVGLRGLGPRLCSLIVTHPLPSSSIFFSIFSITLVQLCNAFNGQLHLMPSCLPWPLQFPWNHRHVESEREAKGTNSPWDQYAGTKETLLCVSLWFRAGCLWASLRIYKCCNQRAALQWCDSQSAYCGQWLQTPQSNPFQPAVVLAAFMSSTSALRYWLLHPTKYFSRVLGS